MVSEALARGIARGDEEWACARLVRASYPTSASGVKLHFLVRCKAVDIAYDPCYIYICSPDDEIDKGTGRRYGDLGRRGRAGAVLRA